MMGSPLDVILKEVDAAYVAQLKVKEEELRIKIASTHSLPSELALFEVELRNKLIADEISEDELIFQWTFIMSQINFD